MSNPFIEFREINPDSDDPDIQVYFLGTLVQTIRHTGTRPGGHIYVEKEQAVKRAEQAAKHLWNLVGEATPESSDAPTIGDEQVYWSTELPIRCGAPRPPGGARPADCVDGRADYAPPVVARATHVR